MGPSWVKIFEGSVIGAILWAVAMAGAPQLSQAREESRLPTLVDRLQTLRTAVAQYHAEHKGLWPGQTRPGGAVTAEAFTQALLGERVDGGGRYLAAIPDNPFMNNLKLRHTIRIATAEDESLIKRTAWRFCSLTGELTAGDSGFHAAY